MEKFEVPPTADIFSVQEIQRRCSKLNLKIATIPYNIVQTCCSILEEKIESGPYSDYEKQAIGEVIEALEQITKSKDVLITR